MQDTLEFHASFLQHCSGGRVINVMMRLDSIHPRLLLCPFDQALPSFGSISLTLKLGIQDVTAAECKVILRLKSTRAHRSTGISLLDDPRITSSWITPFTESDHTFKEFLGILNATGALKRHISAGDWIVCKEIKDHLGVSPLYGTKPQPLRFEYERGMRSQGTQVNISAV
jgi:hypothetical protein